MSPGLEIPDGHYPDARVFGQHPLAPVEEAPRSSTLFGSYHAYRQRGGCGLTTPPQVGVDHQFRIVFDQRAIDLHIFDDTLNIVARFGDRDALDPVDRINFRIAWIAILLDPFLGPAWPGVIRDKCQDI